MSSPHSHPDAPFRRIVVADDGTAASSDAAALGHRIATETGALLLLAGVFPPTLFAVPGSLDRPTLRRQVEESLRRDRDAHAPHALVHAIPDGNVVRAVRHHAQRWRADLLITGSRAGTADGRAALGRHGRQLLLHAPFAVAVAVSGYAERPAAPRRITVGWDGGPESERALATAEGLALCAGGTLDLETVVADGMPSTLSRSSEARACWQDLCEQDRERALAAAEARAAGLRVPAEVRATLGDPGYTLRDAAEGSDLIVVGSRRWGMSARLVTGAVGETLIDDSPCSLVIVPRVKAAPRPRRVEAPATGAA